MRNDLDTQEARILAYLKRGKTLTQLQALRRFNSFRLAARVHRLRGDGHKIRAEMVVTDAGRRFARYSL